MSLIKRGDVWWLDVVCQGKRIRQSLKTRVHQEALIKYDLILEQHFSNDTAKVEPIPNAYITKILCAASGRAKQKGKVFKLTKSDLIEVLERSGGKCEVTKIPFNFSNTGEFSKRPFVPSIDRINPKGIYEKSNCRIVCLAANIAMNEWGEAVFKTIAKAFYANAKSDTKNFEKQLLNREARKSSYSL
jgi:hypothetical protein